jgi:hypothetical protein
MPLLKADEVAQVRGRACVRACVTQLPGGRTRLLALVCAERQSRVHWTVCLCGRQQPRSQRCSLRGAGRATAGLGCGALQVLWAFGVAGFRDPQLASAALQRLDQLPDSCLSQPRVLESLAYGLQQMGDAAQQAAQRVAALLAAAQGGAAPHGADAVAAGVPEAELPPHPQLASTRAAGREAPAPGVGSPAAAVAQLQRTRRQAPAAAPTWRGLPSQLQPPQRPAHH